MEYLYENPRIWRISLKTMKLYIPMTFVDIREQGISRHGVAFDHLTEIQLSDCCNGRSTIN